MLTATQNERLTRVGPGTPMGRMLRQYWFPALLAEELTPGCDPVNLRLLGENLVAFRDERGRVGILPERCPHRGASVGLARAEAGGLRCLFHGWVMDVNGAVLETPNEPEDSTLKSRVPPNGYLVREAGGVIWIYMGRDTGRDTGRAKTPPPFPNYAWTTMQPKHVMRMKAITDSNYAQSVEGVIDSVHTNFLHSTALRPAQSAGVGAATDMKSKALTRPSLDKHPKMRLQDTAYGFRYGAIRKPLEHADKNQYVRTTLWVAPSTVLFPAGHGEGFMQIFTPIDDETTIFWSLRYSYAEAFSDEEHSWYPPWVGLSRDDEFLDANYRSRRNRGNHWQQDRAAMRRGESFSGIKGVNMEDFAMAESMGAISDRTQEHLGTTDLAVVHMRRMMLRSLEKFEAGEQPVGLAEPVPYQDLRADDKVIPLETSWQTVGAYAGEPVEGEVSTA